MYYNIYNFFQRESNLFIEGLKITLFPIGTLLIKEKNIEQKKKELIQEIR